jgi:pyruvate/2-oxoglutarate dehydrogenase complex dihydrolipoamide dehydrogenase (E3) component
MNLQVLVIGAGTAGADAANFARKYSDSVGIIEKSAPGGDCVFNACMPTKALIEAARLYKKMRKADSFGLPVSPVEADYRKVKEFKDGIINRLGSGRESRFTKAGIKLLKGNARFISPHEVMAEDEVITAENIIVATGSLPGVPPVPGLKETGYITNIEALKLEKPPERLAIIGGGPIGVEFAQIFSAFGSRVHIYEVFPRIMAAEDEDISGAALNFFIRQGISVTTATKVELIEKSSGGKVITTSRADGTRKRDEYDEILVAAGRKPAIDDLNLGAAGIEFDRKGIKVDNSTRTNVPHIWAAGDVTGTALFTLIAWEQGELAGANAARGERKILKYDVLPRVTFCDPEAASVGLTERQARERGNTVKTGRYEFSRLDRTVLSNETAGFVKIVAEQGSGRILGGHIIGIEASSLIHEIAVAMSMNLTVSDIGNTFHAFPTYSEAVRYACQNLIEQV